MIMEWTQDLLPVILFMSLAMTVAGAAFWQVITVEDSRFRYTYTQSRAELSLGHVDNRQCLHTTFEQGLWVTRMAKRKESPEDDDSECLLSSISYSN
ncbi:hypothetical protein FLK61_40560 [Paenalkalicoccus suaedae]|uniref:Uncharacterized protein n=1 Tax=Paenalkalicoccus suaedae TaxID=2592382 RepID=A0A859FJ21_9BACI|nr:hypothetical protein [Paenalkalicoccus suaedae]QKS72894.1 hypothetical protein FLK61_40560 [Paenalkalicoccus suaedae]